MEKPIIIVCKKIHQSFYNAFDSSYDVRTVDVEKLGRDELFKALMPAQGLCSMLSLQVNEELLEAIPNLKVIANYAVGFNNVDLDFCRRRKIKVGNTPDVLSFATAEIALLLTIAISRNLRASSRSVENGDWNTWEPEGFLGQDLRGKTLGVYGLGRIGSIYAEKMQELYDVKILYHNRHKIKDSPFQYVSFNELIKESDVLSLHAPLTEANKKVFNKDAFALMKYNCILINTARGGLINENDLYEALKSKQIYGAGVDVTDPEPMSSQHPLLRLDNFLCLPHIGSATETARKEMAEICAENIKRGLNNQVLLHEVL